MAAVLTYNRRESLRACLSAVVRQSVAPARVMVIDNASTDGTAEMLTSAFPGVEIRRMTENLGCTGATWEALRTASASGARYVWLLDDDAIPGPSCLEVLVREMRARENRDGHPPLGLIRPTVADPSTGARMGGGLSHGALLRAALLKAVPFPTPELFIEYDDKAYIQLIRRARYEIVRLPDVLVCHPVRRRKRLGDIVRGGYQLQPWRAYYAIRNRLYVSLYLVPSLRLFLRALGVTVAELTLLTAFGRPRRGQWLLLRGVVDGFRGRLGRRVDPPY